MRTRARTARRTVAALVAAVALAAAPLARADDATPPATSKPSARPVYVVGVAAAFAVTLAVLFFAIRAPAVDSSRLRAATDALDRALARSRGDDAPGGAAHDNRSLAGVHRERAVPPRCASPARGAPPARPAPPASSVRPPRPAPPAWVRLAAAGARALAPVN